MEGCDQSKVFVGGISWETTEDVLKEHFGKYGKVVGAVIAKDRITGSSRGFAFVSFSDASTLNKVLLATHTILGRTVEVKKAVPRSEQNQNQNQQEQSRGLSRSVRSNGVSSNSSNSSLKIKKIFVGGLPANLTEDEFKVYFEKFGRITDVVVMHDNVTRRPRGFGFITFDSEDSVEEVMQKSFHELSGKLVEVKRAVPKEDNNGGVSGGGNGVGNYSSPHRPTYDVVPSYGVVYGGYPYGGGGGVYGGAYYGGMNYGLAPRVPWGPPAMVSIRGGPYPMTVYPAYMNNGHGLMGMVGNGYNGIMGSGPSEKASQIGQLGGGEERVGGDAGSSRV
ncbi:hypothetical protein OSB04_017924 [Centaurea solstitialis]|uniref:RRM domain-containing protein n=1 Tax=Centaurea solstitialis TaxID=347529 RepID=A0AA38WL71_9ASTR|nr:hypothetical protein OSB04_017924 [Centaurea solstitialis]